MKHRRWDDPEDVPVIPNPAVVVDKVLSVMMMRTVVYGNACRYIALYNYWTNTGGTTETDHRFRQPD